MRTKTLMGAAALLGATLFSETASAQQVFEGFAVQKFEPSERGSEWFGNESLDFRGKFRPAIGIVSDYSYRSLLIFQDDGDVRGSVVRNQVYLHPGASFVLFDRLRLAVNVPIQAAVDGHRATVFRQGPNGVVITDFAPPPDSGGMGDVRLGADVRIAGKYGDAFTLAAGMQLWLPTGSEAQYAGDGFARLKPRVMAAGDIGAFTYAGSVGMNFRTRGNETLGPAGIGHELNLTAALGLKVLDKSLVIGPEAWMSSVVTNDHFLAKKWTPLEVGLGVHYLIGNQIRIGAAGMTGPVRAWSNPVYRLIAMAEWAPGVDEDRDGDGIPDREDACPDQKGVRSAEPSRNGCPALPPPVPVAQAADRDGDGILDAQDACPDTPGVRTNDPATNGCRDTDGDGIFDPKDACPTEKGLATQDPVTNGCPDTDGDGIFDKVDACPTEPGLKSEDPKKNGCPVGDKDKDGVKDDVDACPDEPGPADPDPKRNGCPKAFISNGQIKILDQVKFKFGSAAIETGKDSDEVLDAVQKVLTSHPEIKKLRIEGHTDNKGTAQLNKKLSGDRAASVKGWLTKHGIAGDRLSTQGFGLEKPIDTNETEQGRKNNRRVEFHIE